MKNNNKQRSGFTLIEILIVVAIIAILASVVLVGLGPTQQAGRDARRISDLREVQNGLELYYNKCGYYPGPVNCGTGWGSSGAYSDLTSASGPLIGSGIGVSTVPNDPTNGKTYYYTSFSSGSTYTLGAVLENANNSVFVGYNAPSNVPSTMTSCTSPDYCMSL
jgi:prepilin-type N-terminal cleavage/methylation domain-containing protein